MKVVFLSPGSGLGGAERSLLDLVASLRAAAPEAKLEVLAADDGPLLREARVLGADARPLPLPRALARLGDSGLRGAAPLLGPLALGARALAATPATLVYARALRRALEASAPDVVHSNGNKFHLLARVATPPGVPVIWHVRDALADRPVLRRALSWARARASAAIAISEAVARDARAALAGLEVVVVPNAIDTAAFAPGPGDGAWLDAQAPAPLSQAPAPLSQAPAPLPTARTDVVRVGLVATYARWKGHALFLEAARRVLAAEPDAPVRFYVVGAPIYATRGSQLAEGELRALARSTGLEAHVAFVPFVDDAPRVHRALDVLVHASTRPEPFGRTIVEAMACGRAVVAATEGGPLEIVTPGRDGLLVPPRDPDALARAIAALVRDPERRRALGEAARRTAVERFSRERLGPRVLALYERVLGART